MVPVMRKLKLNIKHHATWFPHEDRLGWKPIDHPAWVSVATRIGLPARIGLKYQSFSHIELAWQDVSLNINSWMSWKRTKEGILTIRKTSGKQPICPRLTENDARNAKTQLWVFSVAQQAWLWGVDGPISICEALGEQHFHVGCWFLLDKRNQWTHSG